MDNLRELINIINEQDARVINESYSLEIDFETVDPDTYREYADDPEELIKFAQEFHGDEAWQVVNDETGEIVGDYEGEGALLDPRRSGETAKPLPQKKKQVMDPRNFGFDEDDWDFVDDGPIGISDKEASMLAQRIADDIGQGFPDKDPADSVSAVLSKAGHGRGFEIDQDVAEQVRKAFEKMHGGDFYDYYNELLTSFQADNPGQFDDYQTLEEKLAKGDGKADIKPCENLSENETFDYYESIDEYENMSDSELLRLARGGNEEAKEVLSRRGFPIDESIDESKSIDELRARWAAGDNSVAKELRARGYMLDREEGWLKDDIWDPDRGAFVSGDQEPEVWDRIERNQEREREDTIARRGFNEARIAKIRASQQSLAEAYDKWKRNR